MVSMARVFMVAPVAGMGFEADMKKLAGDFPEVNLHPLSSFSLHSSCRPLSDPSAG
jgi:hypothetical protein